MPAIVSISATNRPDNYTYRALSIVNDELSDRKAEVISFDAREMSLSFPGLPPTEDSERLKNAVEDATGVIIATPEYHGSYSAMAKLIIENLGFPSVLSGKPVALVGVAAGRIGAIKSLEQLRGVCSHVGAIALPRAVSIAGVQQAFTEDGTCTDGQVETALRGVAHSLLDFIDTYICPKYTLESMIRTDDKPWISNI